MWSLILENDTNELIYKTEIDLMILKKKNKTRLPKGNTWEEGKSGAWDEYTHTIYNIYYYV